MWEIILMRIPFIDNKIRLHSYRFGNYWFSKGRRVYKSTSFHPKNDKKLYFIDRNSSILSECNIYNRLTRSGIYNIIPINPDRVLLVTEGKIITLLNGSIINRHKIKYGNRPIKSGICVLSNGYIIYGDYWGNKSRRPVHMYISRDKGESWKVLWKSRPNFARHIHFVKPDPEDNNYIYFGTGDYGDEPGIYKLNLASKNIEIVGKGSQKWRAVDIIISKNKLIWGTDCEFGRNYIYSLNFNIRKLQEITELPGPAYYTTRDKSGNIYLGTTIENRKEHRSCIYKSSNGNNWEKIEEFKKDFWNSRLFGYGIIEFIGGQENLKSLHYNLRGLK